MSTPTRELVAELRQAAERFRQWIQHADGRQASQEGQPTAIARRLPDLLTEAADALEATIKPPSSFRSREVEELGDFGFPPPRTVESEPND